MRIRMKSVVSIYQDENGIYIAECPSIPGCVSQGQTEAEAEVSVADAIRHRTWDGTANKPMLEEFRAAWRRFLAELKDDLRPIFEHEIDKQRNGFKCYEL
jgi:hypothetical protein